MNRHRLLAPLILLTLSACASPPDTGGETVLERRDSYAIALMAPGSPPTQEPFGNRITLIRYATGDYWLTTTLHSTKRCRTRIDPALGERIALAWHRASPLFAQINRKYAGQDYEVVLQSAGPPIQDGNASTPLDAVERRLSDLTDAMDIYCREFPRGSPDRLDASLRAMEQN
ncbi:MAG: hypothetical protein V4559_00330 [Pseudomonadota bacterium]